MFSSCLRSWIAQRGQGGRSPSLAIAAAGVLLAGCAGGPPAQAQAPIALSNVSIIDGTGSAPQPGMTILVEGGRIAAIFPVGSRPLPAGTIQLDVAGSFVIPGLIDAHVHLATFDRSPDIARALLRFALLGGVTTVRDMGGHAEQVLDLARTAAPDTASSPRIYASAVFAGASWFASYDSARVRFWSGSHTQGRAPWLRLIDDATDIPEAVRGARALGVRGIKLYSGLTPEQVSAIGQAAAEEGLLLWGHAVAEPSGPGDIVGAWPTTLSHADQLIWTALAPGMPGMGDRELRARLLNEVRPDTPAFEALYRRMIEHQVQLEPTLLIMQLGDVVEGRLGPLGPLQAWAVAATRAAHQAGVPIVAGSDAIGRQTPYLHTELQLLVRQVGLTPLEAIQAATEHGARALGIADSTGTIAVGKWADLVVLRADPSLDIRNTQTVRAVLRGGVLHTRTAEWQVPPGAEPPEEGGPAPRGP